MTSSDSSQTSLTINVTVAAASGQRSPSVRAYLFDAAGRLVDSALVREGLVFPIDPAQRYRVTVGPDLAVGERIPADASPRLLASSALSQDYLPGLPVDSVRFDISAVHARLWLLDCINIHGTVRKHLNPGGTPPAYAPICTGTVQIFTIDLACSLDNVSDGDLMTLKNTVLARMLGVELADIFGFNFADFARLSSLAAGLYPLSGSALRAYLVNHRAELATFMCELIPEWAICYQQLPDAAIASDGTLSLTHCFYFWEAPPDLYFEVVQVIDGLPTEVADPDILCTTMWGYDGTQAALITVEDPSAVACTPDPNPGPAYLYVWPTAIGNVDLRNIDGIETLTGTGLLPGDTPWGGTLSLQMQFDPNLLSNNINYYRWSYRFDGDVDYTQINTSVTHRWMEETITAGHIDIHLHPVVLGPQLVGGQTNLYAVPDPSLPWIDIDDPADRPFAYFDSTTGAGRFGMVTLRLEMFDGAGNHLASGNPGVGPFTYLLPDLTATPNDYTDAPAPNIDGNGDLIFKVYVDNRPTHSALPEVDVAGHAADDCGMVHYTDGTDPVDIYFVATQPGNFLDWNLSVNRGLHGQVAALSGHTSSATPDHFLNSAATLVGTCVQAAFAVNLDNWARATNGYSRQSQYDSSATIAFALLTP